MENVGWIRLRRKEKEWLKALSDQEERYYLTSRLCAVWDPRNKLFGTFDARTKVVREEMLPGWSIGKISTIKNSLLRRGAYRKTDDPRRLKLTNATLLLGSNKYDAIIQQSEQNLLFVEYDLQRSERVGQDVRHMLADLALSKKVKSGEGTND